MCSYEKPEVGFSGRDLGNRAGNLSHMNTPARYRDETSHMSTRQNPG